MSLRRHSCSWSPQRHDLTGWIASASPRSARYPLCVFRVATCRLGYLAPWCVMWTMPEVVRIDEPTTGDEEATLRGLLEWHRSTLLWKCSGLTADELTVRSVPPSTLSLLGVVRHLADAERAWFRRYFRGEQIVEVYARSDAPNAAFDETDARQAEADVAQLMAEWEASRLAVTGASLEDRFIHEQLGEISLRWVYNHMIAEYARHLGHTDLLRQLIDGGMGE
jgi:hypothetical protein